ncbi:hypothetical protein CPAR01_00345 [Colletotrichum paranaense]|uniref:Uncharacterized protein n=1 Tax=Colletotrichum paranaense TaxID=1914294 RepID=A0ABQ9T3M3_9PEZI|nr:uncharacterized protein CPAR01_00345 [Colletotrichum paranaense]KAK1546378.1 hypothetical protein CPAR01_00345 [Colletotrichum paranaense]
MGVEQNTTPSEMIHKSSRLRLADTDETGLLKAFQWPPRFFKRQLISYEWENSPWICANFGARERPDKDTQRNDIAFFLQIEDNWTADTHRLNTILDLFHGESLQLLENGAALVPRNEIAIVIDGNISTGNPCLRSFQGGLTAAELLKYLCQQTEGPETFCLEFSIPYPVWRSTKTLAKDSRVKTTENEPLRASRDVTFLRKLAGSYEDADLVDGIYSSHMSVMVTGHDEARWTGVGFLESWFEAALDSPSPDMISCYESDVNGGCILDPLNRGKQEASMSSWLPRQYFLRVLELRLRQVLREWDLIIDNLTKRVQGMVKLHRGYLRDSYDLLALSCSHTDWDSVSQRSEDWEEGISHLKNLLDDLNQTIKETVRAGDAFMAADINFFLTADVRLEEVSDNYPYLAEIRRNINILRQLEIRLGSLQDSCSGLLKESVGFRETRIKVWSLDGTPRHPKSDYTNSREALRIGIDPEGQHGTTRKTQSVVAANDRGIYSLGGVHVNGEGNWNFGILFIIAGLSSHLTSMETLSKCLLLLVVAIPIALMIYASFLLAASLAGSGRLHSPEDLPQDPAFRDFQSEPGGQWIRVLSQKLDMIFGRCFSDSNELVEQRSGSATTEGVNRPGPGAGRVPHISVKFGGRRHQLKLIKTRKASNRSSSNPAKEPTPEQDDIENAYIPLCIPVECDSYPALEVISSEACQDDKTFFEALRNILKKRLKFTWDGLLCYVKLRQPIGMHYVKVKPSAQSL